MKWLDEEGPGSLTVDEITIHNREYLIDLGGNQEEYTKVQNQMYPEGSTLNF